MKFHEKYTTEEKKQEDKLKKKEEQTEQTKTVVSNDSMAVCELLQTLTNKLEQLRLSALRK